MNQKKLRYILIGGLALVWGMIIYKIIERLSQHDPTSPELFKTASFDYHMRQDSFILIANYQDPFLPAEDSLSFGQINVSAIDNSLPGNKPILQLKPAYDLNKIQYKGMIYNPENKKRVAILSIDGKEYLAKEKEKIDQVLVSKIAKEKITVVIDGKTARIARLFN